MATFTVTTFNDSGEGSLRQAILDANALAGDDLITFDPSLFNNTIRLISGELQITDDLTIDGDLNDDGIPDISVDAARNSRVFMIDDSNDSFNSTVMLDGLIVTRGRTLNEGESGGGIFTTEN